MWPLIGFLVGTATCLPTPPTQHNQSTPFRLASTNTNGMLLSSFHISKEYEKQCQSPLSDILNFTSNACINLHVTQEANHGPAHDNEGWTHTLNKLIAPFHMHLARSNTSKQGLASILDESTNSSLYGRESLANGSIQILRFGSSNDPKNRARFFTVFNVYAPTAPAISEDSAANYTIWADELIRLVQKEKKNNTRILIIGDLNLAPINTL